MSLVLRGKEFNNEILGISVMCYKDEDNKLWFVGKEVARMLGYAKPRNAINRHVKPKHKREIGTGETTSPETGWVQSSGALKRAPLQSQTLMIDESGFWALACRSQLPAADDLREWIYEDVLPNIREHGYYALPGVLETIRSIEDEKICELQGEKRKYFRRESKHKSGLAKDPYYSELGKWGNIIKRQKQNIHKDYVKKLEDENKNLKEHQTELENQVDELTQELDAIKSGIAEILADDY